MPHTFSGRLDSSLQDGRNFANKVKNASRFVLMNLEGYEPSAPEPVTPADRWIFSRLAKVVAAVDAAYDNFEFGEITRELYSFVWNEFCDWYIEFSKARLAADADPADRAACQRNLVFVLGQILRLLHPIMPFITEEVYGEMPKDEGAAPMLIVAPWPDAAELSRFVDEESERAIAMVCEVVGAVRSTRSRYGISPKVALPVAVKVAAEADAALLLAQAHLIGQLANVEELEVAVETSKPAESAVVLGSGLEVYIVLAGHVDFDAERARLVRERDGLAKDVAKFEKKLSNPGFLAKAAPEIVEKDKAKLADLADKLARIEAQLAELG